MTGIEADIEWTNIEGDESGGPGDFGADVNWQGSIRGRLGYAFNRALIYGTGGFALADIDTEVTGGTTTAAPNGAGRSAPAWTSP